jgi:hypothetical protein
MAYFFTTTPTLSLAYFAPSAPPATRPWTVHSGRLAVHVMQARRDLGIGERGALWLARIVGSGRYLYGALFLMGSAGMGRHA